MMGATVPAKQPLSARHRLLRRMDQAKVSLQTVDALLGRGRDQAAFRELTFCKALLVGAWTELEAIATPPLDPAAFHSRSRSAEPPPEPEIG